MIFDQTERPICMKIVKTKRAEAFSYNLSRSQTVRLLRLWLSTSVKGRWRSTVTELEKLTRLGLLG